MNLFGFKMAGRASARPAKSSYHGGRVAHAPILSRMASLSAGGAWPRSYEAQVRELYLGNAIAQASVRLVAQGLAAAPIRTNDDTALALVKATSAGQSLLEAVTMQLLLHGNAYVEIMGGADARPAELYALRPERVSIEADTRGWPSAFVYRVGNAVSRIPAERMIHLRLAHPLDDHYGLGCLAGAAGAIAIHNSAAQWNKALLDNAARPSGALVNTASEALSAEQFDRLKAELDANFAGAVNAGRPLLLDGGLSWQAMSLSPADMDFVGLKAAAAREIALAFGVPPMLLGLPGDATYANYREANRALWRQAILPLAAKILDGLAEGLRRWFAGLTLEVDLDQVTALAEDRERLWAQLDAASFLTVNEKRVGAGFPALDFGEFVPEADESEAAAPEKGAEEVKFNLWHDPDNGQFTFSNQGTRSGGTIAAMAKPPEKPKLPTGGFRTADGRVIVNRATATNRPPDTARVGARNLGEAINILTNETNGLSGGPSGELARAKTALAHTIQNGLRQPRPPQVAPFTLSDQAGSSIGRNDDIDVMQQVHVAKENRQADPVNGAIYFGTSPSLITNRRIGSGRQDVLQRFGPFDHGSGPKQYVYIYGKSYIPKGK